MSAEKALFIHSDTINFFYRPAVQPSLDGSAHYRMNRIPVELEQLACSLDRTAGS
jgi:hypothetical protein